MTMTRNEAEAAARKELIRAGDFLSVCAQTTGGTAGPDSGLIEAIERWTKACAAMTHFEPAPTFRTSRKPAPGVMGDDLRKELAIIAARLDEIARMR